MLRSSLPEGGFRPLVVTLQGRGFLLPRFLGVGTCGSSAPRQMWTVSVLVLKMVGEKQHKFTPRCVDMIPARARPVPL